MQEGLDVFVLKLNSSGATSWAVRTGSLYEDMGSAIGVDAIGSVYVTGHFTGTNNFGGGNMTSTYSGIGSANVMDTFIWKLNSAGAYSWIRKMNNTSQNRAYGLAIDSSGNVIISGSFQSSIDLIGGFTNYVTSAGSYDVFVGKVAGSDGAYAWLKRFGGLDSDESFAVAADPTSANVVATGYFRGAVNFGGGSVASAGSDDIFVLKLLGSDGSYSWSKTAGWLRRRQGAWSFYRPLWKCHSDWILFLAGANFGGPTLVSAGLWDGFLVKYTSAGAFIWSERFGGPSNEIGLSIAVDTTGYILSTGYFSSSFTFATIPVTSAGLG